MKEVIQTELSRLEMRPLVSSVRLRLGDRIYSHYFNFHVTWVVNLDRPIKSGEMRTYHSRDHFRILFGDFARQF